VDSSAEDNDAEVIICGYVAAAGGGAVN